MARRTISSRIARRKGVARSKHAGYAECHPTHHRMIHEMEGGAVRLTSQVASGMIHLMAVGIWIWGSSFLSPQALIPVNSGRKGLLTLALRPLFAALMAFEGVLSLRVLKAYTF